MKIRTLALTAIALSSAATSAVASVPADAPTKLATVVAHMEMRYPGEVVAIEFDGSGDKGPHYHVAMRFPESGMAHVDVDATTFAIASRDPAPTAERPVSLAYAAALVGAYLSGEVVVAELDAFGSVAPHYDIDVRLAHGPIARLKVDPATRQIAWRNPALVDE
jgi:hypothetical protein